MRILEDVGDGKIRRDITGDERSKGERHKQKLRDRGPTGDRHQDGIVLARAVDRYDRLNERQPERQHQRIMTKLSDHGSLALTASSLTASSLIAFSPYCVLPCGSVAALLSPLPPSSFQCPCFLS